MIPNGVKCNENVIWVSVLRLIQHVHVCRESLLQRTFLAINLDYQFNHVSLSRRLGLQKSGDNVPFSILFNTKESSIFLFVISGIKRTRRTYRKRRSYLLNNYLSWCTFTYMHTNLRMPYSSIISQYITLLFNNVRNSLSENY